MKCVAAAPITLTALLVPVMPLAWLSVATSVWLPAVTKVAVKLPLPPINMPLAGNIAALSLLENVTVPL